MCRVERREELASPLSVLTPGRLLAEVRVPTTLLEDEALVRREVLVPPALGRREASPEVYVRREVPDEYRSLFP